ncbi:MAG: putative porin [Mucilaginibacter sp.]|uniref:putative porin n=1 Tax=Mucilaginibacter sp. TaxID=1882438 RepID=UPI0034E6014F
MILKPLKFLLFLIICLSAPSVYAQYGRTTNSNTNTNPFNQNDTTKRKPAKALTDDQLLDTLRKRDEHKGDTVIFTSKFIRVTNEKLLNDSTQVLPLDTTLTNFENYSSLYQPRNPKIGLGNLGLADRSLLFEPVKKVGFDIGLHALDDYLLRPEDITYYRARTPFTNLYYVNGALKEQVFRVTHTQNIKPNWNIGFNFNRIGSVGFYPRQKADHLEAAIFTWYESKSKRYNLLGNLNFNNLKMPENGSILSDTIFNGSSGTTGTSGSLSKSSQPVRLNNSRDNWRNNSIYIKQFYYIGRTEGLKTGAGSSSSVLPTQRVSHTFTYNTQKYTYLQDEADQYHVFPLARYDSLYSRDSVMVKHIRNDFSYSFYLRGNAVKFVRNELKLDLGLVHDYYNYSQYVRQPGQLATSNYQQLVNHTSFQDITLKARLGYNLSNRAALDANFQQVTLGREFGDYLYDAKLNVLLGNKIGRVILEGYTQSNTAPIIFTNWTSSHYDFHNSFSKPKTTGLSFNYQNDKLQFDAKAEYFLLNNYLYFQVPQDSLNNNPKATQNSGAISLLKISIGKNFTWRSLHLDNFFVYQKTDNANVLRTPEYYVYSSFYYTKRFFNVLHTNMGFAVRYNSTYLAQAYAPGIGQFYNTNSANNVTFPSYPVVDFFIKGTLRRTNLFLKYDYANQGLFSKGFYTVIAPGGRSGYPMQDKLLKFGVSWNFYD